MSVPFGNYQYEIYLAGMADQVPEHPMSWADWEAAAAAELDDGPRGYLFGGAGTEDSMRANLAAFRRLARRAADAARRRRARDGHRAAGHRAAGAGADGPGRRPVDPPPRRRAGQRPRGGVTGRAGDREHRGLAHAGGDRRGRRRRPALVSALLAARRGARGELRAPGGGGGLRRAGRDARHAAAGLAPARPRRRLPAVPAAASASPTTSPTRSSARRWSSPPRRTRRPPSASSSGSSRTRP